MGISGGERVNWTDNAVLLTVAQAGKRTLVLEVLTENYGRCRAITILQDQAPVLLPGSFLKINCTAESFDKPLQAKLIEIEGGLMASKADDVGLLALTTAKDLMVLLLDEEDPVPEVFDYTYAMMASLVNEDKRWAVHYAALEFALLAELGHIDGISDCLPAFRHGDAIYISPRTGRAVPREQAGAFLDKLMSLPGFLLGGRNASVIEVRQALELNEQLLMKFALPDRNVAHLPETRDALVQSFRRIREIPRATQETKRPVIDDEARRKRMMSSKPLLVACRKA